MTPFQPTQVWDIASHLCGLPFETRRKRLLLVLKAFIDDSGKDDPPVFVLAGFVGRAQRWAEFSDRWKEALQGPPSIDYFKMNEASSLTGQFQGWDSTTRDERVMALARTIKDYALAGISALVSHAEYRQVMVGKVNPFMDRAYLLLYFNVMYSAFQWEIDNEIEEEIDFIFDEQLYDSDVIQSKFSDFTDHAPEVFRKRFGQRPIHANDKKVLPLQAADMFAWHVRRDYFEQARGGTLDSPAWRLLREIPHQSTVYTKDRLDHFASRLDEINREDNKLFEYQVDSFFENVDLIVTRRNAETIASAKAGETIHLVPIPANGMGRFLLVHSCPQFHKPHLHRRVGDACLGAA